MSCKICGGTTAVFGHLRLLAKYDATYHRCGACGYLFVDEPTWLVEAYDEAVAEIDVGQIERMTQQSRRVKLVLHYFLDPAGACLDYGAGYGLLVRRMRDLGYNFNWFDRYCTNLFARDYVGGLDQHYHLLTAFEVIEHLTDPLQDLSDWSKVADNLLLSTQLIGRTPPPLYKWPYYTPESGQHIGFFTMEALQEVAKRLGLHLASDGFDFHLLSRKPVDSRLFRYAMKHRVGRILNVFVARRTLLYSDATNARKVAVARLAARARSTSAEDRDPSATDARRDDARVDSARQNASEA